MRIGKIAKGMATTFFLLSIMVGTVHASCEEQRLVVGALSYHFDRTFEYNEENPAIGWWCDGWGFVVFKNSYYETSHMIGKELPFRTHRWFSGYSSVELSIADGYEAAIGDGFQPAAFLKTNITFNRFHIVARTNPWLATLSFEYRL